MVTGIFSFTSSMLLLRNSLFLQISHWRVDEWRFHSLSSASGTPINHFPTTSRRLLDDWFNVVRSSEYHRLAVIFNVSKAFEHRLVYPEDLAAILVGIQDAMQLPHMAESTLILGPLSASIRRLLNATLVLGARSIKRDAISREATRTIQLVRSSLASRLISGRHNSRIVACARGRWSIDPADGRLEPYEG